MERKIKHLLVLVGILMSSAAALIPLTSYAAKTAPFVCTGNSTSVLPNGGGTGTAEGNGYGDEIGVTDFANHCPTITASAQVDVNVYDALVLSVETNPDAIEVYPNDYNTGSMAVLVYVRTNKNYTLSMSANQPYLFENQKEEIAIPPRAGDLQNFVEDDLAGWGIRVHRDDDSTDGYEAISYLPKVFYTSDDELKEDSDNQSDFERTTTFDVGVAVSSRIPAGTYSTEVKVTAAVTTD